jgi:hypothetical protein
MEADEVPMDLHVPNWDHTHTHTRCCYDTPARPAEGVRVSDRG